MAVRNHEVQIKEQVSWIWLVFLLSEILNYFTPAKRWAASEWSLPERRPFLNLKVSLIFYDFFLILYKLNYLIYAHFYRKPTYLYSYCMVLKQKSCT